MNSLYNIILVLSLLIYGSFVGHAAIPPGSSSEESAKVTPPLSDSHITGHVTDTKTGDHLPYINVSIKGTTIGGMTDGTGHFLLKNLPLGKHTIVISSIGYKNIERAIDIKPRRTEELFFSLEEESVAVDEVVVTSNRNETNRRETSTIVNVISPLTIERTASVNLSEALNYQSGLRVEFNCGNCGVPQLRINGLEGQYTQILLDSRPVFSSLASVYGLEQLPTEMIQRVEVIRGGGSALFGSNAIGGVVNIITKEPLRNFVSVSNQTQLIGGSALDLNTSINASFVTDDYKSGIYLYGVMKDRAGYDRNGDGFTEIPTLNSETFGFRAYHRLTNYSRLTAEYHHIREFRRGGDMMDRPPHEANIAEQLEHRIDGGGLKYDLFSANHKHRFSAYTSVQNINRRSYFGTSQNPDAYGKTHDITAIVGGQYTYGFEKLWFLPADLTVGAEYQLNDLKDEILGYNRLLEQKVYTYGGYVQNEWKNSRWSILIGARLDKHNLMKNPVVSPRATARFSPTKNVGLRLSYASGYRAPQAYEEDLHVGAVGGDVSLIVLDPDLRPEYSHSISASADLYKRLGQWETNFLVEPFFTKIKDVFTLVENGRDQQGNLILMRTNESGGHVAGVNLEAKASYKNKAFIQAGYTFQQSRYDDPHTWSEESTLAPQRRMFRAPDLYGYLSLGYNFNKQWNINLTGNHTGPMLVKHYAGYVERDSETTTQHFFDAAARIAYEFKLTRLLSMELNGGVKNIFDSFQKDIDRGVDKDAGYIYGPALPRTYYIGAKVKF